MKKPSPELFARQQLQSKHVDRLQKRNRQVKHRHKWQLERAKRRGRLRIKVVAPKRLEFHGSPQVAEIFDGFVGQIAAGLKEGFHVQLDLRKVELLLPCGVLLLLSYVGSWIHTYPGKLTANYPSNEIVEQMLQSVGILKKLGLSDRMVVSREEVTRWYHFKGDEADASPMTPFMEEAQRRLGLANQSALYDSVVEAITNVKQHAYGAERVDKRWWMFALIDATHVFVAILDVGRSIPGTLLEKPSVWEQVKTWGPHKKTTDVKLLRAAMGGKSRTRLRYRGRGLPEMLQYTRAMVGSDLSIYSRQALFFCNSASGREGSTTLHKPINGTLLLWSIKTSGGANDDAHNFS